MPFNFSVAEAAPHAGPEGIRAFFDRYYQAMPDLHWVIGAPTPNTGIGKPLFRAW